MIALCPRCNKALDPAFAPIAKVVGTRILSFCSSACAEARVASGESPSSGQARHDADEPVRSQTAPGDADGFARAESELLANADEGEDFDSLAPVAIAHVAAPRRNRRGLVVAIAGAIFVLGMVCAIVPTVSPSSPRTARAAVVAPAPPAPPADSQELAERDDNTPPSPADVRRRAIEVLRSNLASKSPRVRRIAALALVRVGAPEATAALSSMLKQERSELRRIEIAHGLAKAGAQEGVEALHTSLKSKRRDARLDAASALADLGDDTGRRYLRSMLSVRSHKLGAAAALAELGDDRGLELLRKTAQSGKSSPAARMRATVALGQVKQAEVRDELRTILSDGRYQVGAASALARLGDDAAVPVLTKQLAYSSVRVRAAIALRELGAPVDLEPLRAALASGDEVAAVSAAEAIVVLVEPEVAAK